MNNNCVRECTVGGGMGLPSIVGRGQRHKKCGTPCPTMHRVWVQERKSCQEENALCLDQNLAGERDSVNICCMNGNNY